jgi:[ribosomal protein S5]-alanine N-acetyltransferase
MPSPAAPLKRYASCMPIRLCPIAQAGNFDSGDAQPHFVLPEVIDATVSLYERKGFRPPWIGYVAIESDKVVGSCGFASPPEHSEAEIAYFTFPGNEARGVATRMATALMNCAREQAKTDGIRFIAHTLPVNSPSTTILRKLGFKLVGTVVHPEDGEVWKWRYDEA